MNPVRIRIAARKMTTSQALQIGTYGLQTLSEVPEIVANDEWRLELLAAAEHLQSMRQEALKNNQTNGGKNANS